MCYQEVEELSMLHYATKTLCEICILFGHREGIKTVWRNGGAVQLLTRSFVVSLPRSLILKFKLERLSCSLLFPVSGF